MNEPATNSGVSPDLTWGQRYVGLTFNPSGDADVNKAKQLCADLADMVYAHTGGDKPSYMHNLIRGSSLQAILDAQMNIVKLLTLKY